MRYTRFLPTLFLFVVGLWLLPSSSGGATNVQRRTTLTVAEHTEIPGAVLHPGTYTVKVLDYKQGKEIVQFLSEDESKIIATVLAIRDRRVHTDDGQTGFIYFPREEGAPMIALKSWYSSDDEWGEVFVYPQPEAFKLAEATHEEVAATPATTPTLESEVTMVKPAETPQPTTQVAEKAPTTLPKTGSDLPLLALIGLGAFAAAAALRLARRTA